MVRRGCGWGTVPSQQCTMDHRVVLLTLLLGVIFSLLAKSSCDDVKHKKVIIKIPKKINHVHHHHIKKVHIWKHKPKPIHSVHIVEEEDHSALDEWKAKHAPHDKKQGYGAWEGEEEEGGDYDEEHEEDSFKKSGSQFEPIVWREGKRGGKGGKKYRESSSIGGGRGRSKPKNNYKGDRAKRQKEPSYHDDSFQNEFRIHDEYRSSHRKPKSKKPKKTQKNKGPYDRKPRPKSKPKYRPVEKEHLEYVDYDEPLAVWPERKEHISWHQRREPPSVTEEAFFQVNDYQLEHKGEIDLSKQPVIQVVPAPNLELTERPYSDYQQSQILEYQQPQMQEYQSPRLPEYLTTKAPDLPTPKPSSKRKRNRSPQKQPQYTFNMEPEVLAGIHSQLDNNPEGTIAGYSSHVGHNAEGDAASFQSVRFGEKKVH